MSRLELFLDLVFVYAFFATTNLMEEQFGLEGVLEGVLVALLLIRCWVGYLVLGNVVRLDHGVMRPYIFGVALVVVLLAVATPVTFIDRPGGLFGPLVFVVAFVLARLGAILVLIYATWDTGRTGKPAARALLPLCGSGLLLLCGALLPLHLPENVSGERIRIAFFLIAAVVDFRARRAIAPGGWQIVSVGHWTERHRLIVLIALGETIISIGAGRGLTGGRPITWAVIITAALGVLIVGVLWWSYIDTAGPAAQQATERQPAATRSRFARDAYSLWHLPQILGLVLVALGLKRALSAVEPDSAYRWDVLGVLVLYGGVLLYLLGLLVLERRTIGVLGRSPLLGISLVVTLVPIARNLPPTAAVGLLAAAVTVMVLADLTVFRGRHRALHNLIAPTEANAAATGVTPRELFLDLVFVNALIQVTILMARHPTLVGAAQGLVVLTLLWGAWCLSAQLGNVLRSESILARLRVLLIVALIMMIGIAAPQAFERVSDGLPGPLIVVACYLALRVLHLATRWRVTRQDPIRHRQMRRAAISSAPALLLLLLAALASSQPHGGDKVGSLENFLWLAAIIVDIASGYGVNLGFWRVPSAKHWSDRFELIMLIALGQAIIATGMALFEVPISWPIIIAVALSTVLLSALWWAYFDVDSIAGYRALQACRRSHRAALARDAYVYLHLPMIAGLMLLAFGLRRLLELIAHTSDSAHARFEGHSLAAGIILFLLANQAFWWRIRREIRWYRMIGILLIAISATFGSQLPPLWALTVFTTATAVAMLVDARRSRGLRGRLRKASSTTITDSPPGRP